LKWALVGYGGDSPRAKWRALRSARSSTPKKNLTWPALSETLIDTEKATGAHTSEADPALLFWC